MSLLKLKRFVALVVSIAFIALLMPLTALANGQPYDTSQIFSDYAILVDGSTGKVLVEKNAYQTAYPASTTKIMTCILVLENVKDLNAVYTAGSEVTGFSSENSLMGISKHEELSVNDLLHGMMLVSGNDAAAMLAVNVGGSIEDFAAMMNAKAAELGLTSTHFVNPHGLHDDEHYTTVADMAALTVYAMQNATFRKIVSTPSYTVKPSNKRSREKELINTNRFINDKPEYADYRWSAVNGVKTGSTRKAQGCLVTSASEKGVNLIAVAFHDASNDQSKRWDDTRDLLKYGFENYATLYVSSLPLELPVADSEITIQNASRKDENGGLLKLQLELSGVTISGLSYQLDVIKADPSVLTITTTLKSNQISAPIAQGDVLGVAAIKLGDQTLCAVDVVASRSVDSADSDPQNSVAGLITGIIETPGGGGVSVLFIVLLALLVLVAATFVFFIVKRKSSRGRKRGSGKVGGRQTRHSSSARNYYNYKK